MVCVSECVLFFRIKPKDNNNNNNKKLSFCILAKFAVVVVDLDVDFDSHSTAKVSNFAFSAQYNKRSNNSNSNNNNNNVVDNVLQQFGQNIVSISDSGQRQLKKFRALLGAIINELPARFPPATLSLSLWLSNSVSVSLSVCLSVCLSLQLSSILGNSFHALPLGTSCCCHRQEQQQAMALSMAMSLHSQTSWDCLEVPGTAWDCLELPGWQLLGSLPCCRFICAVCNVLCPLKQASSRLQGFVNYSTERDS